MSYIAESVLGNTISAEDFLRDYWQKKPLVIRGAFSSELDLISAEELAGYSLEDDIESRIISCSSDDSTMNKAQWSLEQGPFEDENFQDLPEDHWTLLVQSLDYFDSRLHPLLLSCSFLPKWRLDDIMVSYATDQGSVGPHLDKYDVFLVQGEGKRHWRVGTKNQPTSVSENDAGISQILPFEADIDVILETGDVLYVPPNTPHWGISLGESINYSIGFRAPTAQAVLQTALELQEDSADSLSEALWNDDGVLSLESSKGMIDQSVEPWLASQMRRFDKPLQMKRAMAKLVSESKYTLPDDHLIPSLSLCEAQELSELAVSRGVELHSLARMTYIELDSKTIEVFIHGESEHYSAELSIIVDQLNQNYCYENTATNIDKNELREFYTFALLQGAIELIAS